MYLSSYSELYGMSVVSLRLANIIGPRLTHGVIYDFYMKLKKDPTRLVVLGTGKQEKAYQYVSDTVEAALVLEKKLKSGHVPVNVSSGERLTVRRIAEIVCEGLGVPKAKIDYTGSERGWAGDVLATDLEISFLKSFGWESKIELEEGVRIYLDWIVDSYGSVT
jgi:UDP-glucose 4-epimerase